MTKAKKVLDRDTELGRECVEILEEAIDEDPVVVTNLIETLQALKGRYGTKAIVKGLATLQDENIKRNTCESAKKVFIKAKAILLKTAEEIL